MSDVSTAPVVIEQPAAPGAPAPAPEQQGAPPASPERLTVQQARARLREPLVPALSTAPSAEQPEAAQPAPEVRVDEAGRARGPDGRFVEQPAPAESTAGAGDQVPVEGETATEGDGPRPGGDLPAGFVRLEIPEGDPLREQGHEHVPVPQGMEDAFRNLLNRPARRRELEAARTATVELEQAMDRTEAALRAANEFNALLFRDRRVMTTFWQMQEDYGEEAAAQWLHGVVQEQGRNIEGYVTAAQQARNERRHAEAAQQFLGEVQQGRGRYHHWSDQEFQQALSAYAAFAAATNQAELTLQGFRDFADPYYIRHPKMMEMFQSQRAAQEQARQTATREQAAAGERAALERAQQVAQANPLSGLPAGAGTRHEPPAPAAKPLTYSEARRALRG